MSTISSKRPKKHGLVDFVIVFFALLLVFLVLTPLNGSLSNSIHSAFGSAQTNPSISREISFAADLQYWDANCSHGWTSDSTCDVIATKAQSCTISLDSAYCSEYGTYLKQFRN
ncbi:MAG TPA: hypothetical protein VK206_26905 [Anaerolineales bacterium]|nr:hypothetical protein [Anaerolineales bacterium]HLO29745.1 hypothetical protein [Anaerolineales bacterium]